MPLSPAASATPARPGRLSLARFLRGEGPEAAPITLNSRRVYILPSRHGVFFALLMLVMLLGSINYNTSLGYAMTFLLASLGIVAMLHTYRNLLRLRVDVGSIAPVFAGEPLLVSVLLDDARYARTSVMAGFPAQTWRFTDVPANETQRLDIQLPTRARGEYALPRITLQTSFPLGLFKAWAHVQPDRNYLVYPALDVRREPPRDSHYQLNVKGDRGHGSDDFAGLRNYHPGDSPRHVHWKALARERGLHTKQFGGDRAEELWLDWDTLPELGMEARLSRLARWVVDAEAARLTYGLRLPGASLAPGQGPVHRHQCLRALALYQTAGGAA